MEIEWTRTLHQHLRRCSRSSESACATARERTNSYEKKHIHLAAAMPCTIYYLIMSNLLATDDGKAAKSYHTQSSIICSFFNTRQERTTCNYSVEFLLCKVQKKLYGQPTCIRSAGPRTAACMSTYVQ
jgi:hypothetical protein